MNEQLLPPAAPIALPETPPTEEASSPKSLDIPQWPDLDYQKIASEASIRPFKSRWGKPINLSLIRFYDWILGGKGKSFQEIATDTIYESLTVRPEILDQKESGTRIDISRSESLKESAHHFESTIELENQRHAPHEQISLENIDINGKSHQHDGFLVHHSDRKEGDDAVTARAYITVDRERVSQIPERYVTLLFRLKEAGVECSSKALDPFGAKFSTTDIVFYLSSSQIDMANLVFTTFLAEHPEFGKGHTKAGIPSEQEGLTWSREPNQNQRELIREIRGEKQFISFNELIACMAMPAYLHRLHEFYQKKGKHKDAARIKQELERVEAIIKRYKSKEADTTQAENLDHASVPIAPQTSTDI